MRKRLEGKYTDQATRVGRKRILPYLIKTVLKGV
jgi:hypothetical protein